MNYREAVEKLAGRGRRKIGNNTYLEKLDDATVAVRLHSTNVVTFRESGEVVLNSGGWQTVTTKDRINKYSPVGVYQKKRVWYLSDGREFFDGMEIF